ncbi:hypothetical protein JI721_09155 [Alicyclobacillus cycloheptanicus]|nr:hypothetical protein JI721_09155 [Alicyclobacillus cycloheptanicus]
MKRGSKAAGIVLSTMGLGVLLCPSLPTQAAPLISNAPMIRGHLTTGSNASSSSKTHNLGWESTNWSGYVLSGGTYNSITGYWVVPTVQSSKSATYSSSWIGIDGYNDSDLIQTGTEQDYYNGSAHYGAWWEILPAAETPISMTVEPGDEMYADIQNEGNGQWLIEIKDITRNETFSTTQAYSGPQSSAEWIQERPMVGNRLSTLANYGETTFDPASVNGSNPGFTSSESGAMVNNSGTQIISYPSNPDSDTDGFNVAYGSTQPAPPAS